MTRSRDSKKKHAGRRSLHMQRGEWRERHQSRRLGEPERAPVHRCPVCADQPWRRELVCMGCGLGYEPEQIERPSIIGSSAAIAAAHGAMFGFSK